MTTAILCPEQCRQARLSKDRRFDGRFFTGVHSTGIYCRPICPVRPPLERNVRYYASAALAEQAGLRPCLRCRPELAPSAGDWRARTPRLTRALQRLKQQPQLTVAQLAADCFVSERQLRRWFVEDLGVSPLQLQQTERLLQAKQLLTDSNMTITDVALACGFNSVRRFNDAFSQHYRMAPRTFRQQTAPVAATTLQLRLPLRPPFAPQYLLKFFAERAIAGVEQVTDGRYQRWLAPDQWFSVEPQSEQLLLQLQGIEATALPRLRATIERMWDCACDSEAVTQHLALQPQLQALSQRYQGIRVASYFDEWETLLRAILGQQITIAAGRQLLQQLVALHQAQGGFGIPTAEVVSQLDLTPMRMPHSRKASLQLAAQTVASWQPQDWLDLDRVQQQLLALKGIGPWTVNYWRLRCGHDADALPLGDVILRKAAQQQQLADNDKALAQVSQQWRPWRSYATTLLWQSMVKDDANDPIFTALQ
ncbi:Ada metal-binding domain-containing protein [Ferrimonas senticii]|uniref:Ada metal-binding domain-containing protein n=1 Tax=Ferrimonas senticii TaxID=394566 RepID=UPI0006856F41|nr:Ada metal-binding domain-containing protein [Ferrimonas senticii]